MVKIAWRMRKLWADQAGQTTIEWALLMAMVGLPAIALFGMLLGILAENYRMVTMMLSWPFP